jgi:hypothetical protein
MIAQQWEEIGQIPTEYRAGPRTLSTLVGNAEGIRGEDVGSDSGNEASAVEYKMPQYGERSGWSVLRFTKSQSGNYRTHRSEHLSYTFISILDT